MKKGFTLIELLAVMAILAIIMLIATPRIMDSINTSKTGANETQSNLLEKTAKLYTSNLILEETEVPDYVFIEDLINNKLLSNYPVDNLTNKDLSGIIKVDKSNDNYSFNYLNINSTSGEVIKVDQTKTIKNIIVEGNTIQVETTQGKNMIPTNYDEWEAGHYGLADGLKTDHLDRIRTPFFIDVTPSTAYYFNIGSSEAYFIIRSYDINFNFLRSKGTKREGRMDTIDDEEYWSISMYNIPDAQYEEEFTNGIIKPLLCLYDGDHTFEEYIPNSPSFYYPTELKSVTGNLMIDEVSVALPELNGLEGYKDTFNLSTGEKLSKTGKTTLLSTDTWNLDSDYYYTDKFSTGNSTIPVWKVSNAKYRVKDDNYRKSDFYFTQSGAQLFEYSRYNTNSMTEFKTYLDTQVATGKTTEVVYVLKTPITETLSSVVIPSTAKYIYLDGEIKGNIIVEYNE